MRRRNRGTIVQVGSALSYRAIPLQSAYCAAKFAVRGFTDSLRAELAHDGSEIRLTMVQLPAVNTPQFDWARSRMAERAKPLPPVFQPEAVAAELVRAAREAPRELWIGHSTVKAIVGAMLLPETGDRSLSQDACSGKLTAEPHAAVQPDNLFSPPPGDPGARGRFGDGAHAAATGFDPASLQNGGLLLALASLAGAFVAGAWALGRFSDARSPAREREREKRVVPLALVQAKRRMRQQPGRISAA
jgi:hypothetical protein